MKYKIHLLFKSGKELNVTVRDNTKLELLKLHDSAIRFNNKHNICFSDVDENFYSLDMSTVDCIVVRNKKESGI